MLLRRIVKRNLMILKKKIDRIRKYRHIKKEFNHQKELVEIVLFNKKLIEVLKDSNVIQEYASINSFIDISKALNIKASKRVAYKACLEKKENHIYALSGDTKRKNKRIYYILLNMLKL